MRQRLNIPDNEDWEGQNENAYAVLDRRPRRKKSNDRVERISAQLRTQTVEIPGSRHPAPGYNSDFLGKNLAGNRALRLNHARGVSDFDHARHAMLRAMTPDRVGIDVLDNRPPLIRDIVLRRQIIVLIVGDFVGVPVAQARSKSQKIKGQRRTELSSPRSARLRPSFSVL